MRLQFKFRMFGIPMVAGHATNVLCDNESVVKNSYEVKSMLNKKHNLLAYHYVCWAVAAGIITWDGLQAIRILQTYTPSAYQRQSGTIYLEIGAIRRS